MADAAAARDGHTALALRLARYLAPPPAPDGAAPPLPAAAARGNVVFSPVAVHAALALLAAGAAAGPTRDQLLAFLGAPSAAALAAFARRVGERVVFGGYRGSGATRMLFGGGVLVDAARGGITDAFRDAAATEPWNWKYLAQTVSFADEPVAAAEMINAWVKEATDDLIDGVISASDVIGAAADLAVVLASAVYFKASWRRSFDPQGTWPGTFHLLGGGHAEARFMSLLGEMPVACMDGFKVLKLPYNPGNVAARLGDGHRALRPTWCAMLVFLPDARGGLAAMVDAVTAPAPPPAAEECLLDAALLAMEDRVVRVKLPRFSIAFAWDGLEADLRRLGLSLPFSPEEADLGGMCAGDGDGDDADAGGSSRRRPRLSVSKVAHTAVLNVNEVGTEAGAAFSHWNDVRDGPPSDFVEFVADHPFFFLVMEEWSGAILMAGHVLDPTK